MIKLKSFTDAWQIYTDKVYPDGMSQMQQVQIHQAFLAGGAAFGSLLTEAAKGDNAEERIQELLAELEAMSALAMIRGKEWNDLFNES